MFVVVSCFIFTVARRGGVVKKRAQVFPLKNVLFFSPCRPVRETFQEKTKITLKNSGIPLEISARKYYITADKISDHADFSAGRRILRRIRIVRAYQQLFSIPNERTAS